MNRLYREYKDKVNFYLVYVREAHASDGRVSKSNTRAGINYKEPKTLAERAKVATDCVKSLKFDLPVLLDNLDNKVQKTYSGFPARTVIVGPDGKFLYVGRPGPKGIDTKTLESELRKLSPQLSPQS